MCILLLLLSFALFVFAMLGVEHSKLKLNEAAAATLVLATIFML